MSSVRDKKAGIIKVFIIAIAVAAVLIGAVAVRLQDKKPDASRSRSITNTKKQDTTTSPDQVKESNLPNSDTQPSPSGTGPGSDNSYLSQ